MEELSMFERPEQHDAGAGCAYLLDEAGTPRICGAIERRGSPYCERHHTLCHLPLGSVAERNQLREVEALANAVGGRRGPDGAGPPRRFLNRLEQVVRDFS